MKKQIAILIMAILIVAPIVQDVTAAKTVFITSDNVIDQEHDLKVLNSIKSYIEEISGGKLQVIVDNQAPAPGEGWRSIEVTSDVSIDLAASDAGNYLQLGTASANSNKQIIFVNVGDYDLDNHTNFLRRSWDDNYSNESLAGMQDPGTFLKNSGIYYVQPAKEFPNNVRNGVIDTYDEEMNRQIAQEIVDIINTHENDTKVLIDVNKVNNFKINIDLLSQNLDKMYNDIYAVLNDCLNSKIFIDLENEFKINCQLNFPLNKHEILWKLLKETDLQQFIPTKPIKADYDVQLKNFQKINPKLDPKYRDKAYVEYYKKYYYIDNLNIRKDPTLDVPNIQPGIQVDIYNTNNNKMKTIRTDEKNKNFNPNQYKDISNKSNLNAKFDSIANETSNNYPNVSRINDNTYLVGNNNYMNNNNSTNNMNDKYEYLINNQKRN